MFNDRKYGNKRGALKCNRNIFCWINLLFKTGVFQHVAVWNIKKKEVRTPRNFCIAAKN